MGVAAARLELGSIASTSMSQKGSPERLPGSQGGNTSAIKAIGHGVHELRIDTGPGYRIYLARDRSTRAVLLGASTKRRQQREIERCVDWWEDFKVRKAEAARRGR
jgi:putative addiction module killer protein